MSFVVSVPTRELADDLRAGLSVAGERFDPLPADIDVIVWDMRTDASHERLDIVVPPYMSQQATLPRLAGIEVGLVQGQSIGFDGIADVLPAGVRFANATTVHEASTAELALALTLAAQRHLPDFVRSAERGLWQPVSAASLADRRVLLLGYGGVGKAVAARLAGFEVDLTVVARTARDENGVTVHAIDELPALLPAAEVLIVTLPGGAETEKIIDAAALAALPDGALVVNVGRGPLIDTDALVAELSTGRLRAALDVTEPEPLPEGHPLFSLALIAPHVGGDTTAMRPRIARLVRQQIDRMLAGEAPLNVVIG
ncbi:NAD(P)-dependent oxidoreductase [uncultured Microbacterium sp.]|uniref:NAD(P)-dependent oxidoreductase n=1 Tax=uncultured Microbacterium sp. TaxID=191216 RepID=UPI0025DBB9EC|nr:NAD(P)-dependent oxidoreductase [uncultured Microbacterium sp.]